MEKKIALSFRMLSRLQKYWLEIKIDALYFHASLFEVNYLGIDDDFTCQTSNIDLTASDLIIHALLKSYVILIENVVDVKNWCYMMI